MRTSRFLGLLLCSCASAVCASPAFAIESESLEELVGACIQTDAQDVVACLDRVSREHPERADLKIYLASELVKRGELDRALKEVESALAIDPSNTGYHVFRAQLLRAKGDLEGAAAEGRRVEELKRVEIERLLSEPSVDPRELRIAAAQAIAAGDLRTGSALYERYFRETKDPQPRLLGDYAEVLARLGQSEAALASVNRAITEVEAGDLDTRSLLLEKRAWIKELSGDVAGAEDDRRESRELLERIRADSQ